MTQATVIHWFQRDLRLTDNPAWCDAVSQGRVLPIFIWDDNEPKESQPGAASRLWLHHALQALSDDLQGSLMCFKGDPEAILLDQIDKYSIASVCWNNVYEPWAQARNQRIQTRLEAMSKNVHTHNGSLLWEPGVVLKKDGTPYRVFTPFYRRGCLSAEPPRVPLMKPKKPSLFTEKHAQTPQKLELKPEKAWADDLVEISSVGEKAALHKLDAFLDSAIHQYDTQREIPADRGTSRLSAHLHWGEISPNQVWHAAQSCFENNGQDCFLSELGWREFSYNLLHYNHQLPTQNLQKQFDAYPWLSGKEATHLKAWQQGKTGIPMVDAGMRELYQTGFMHNRVRMITASFLVKNLGIHWREGARWFWDCLCDADLASNSAGWQWVAGSGADAAPFFRVFNPVTQGKKFDSLGVYIKRFVPELSDMPTRYLFAPWEASEHVLATAGITLGQDYPKPIVDLPGSRADALAQYKAMRAKKVI